MTLQEINSDPFSIASVFILKNRERITIRPLVKNDASAFGIFLDNLSEETRSRFGPHPISSDEAKIICNNLDYARMLRLVTLNIKKEIIGYMILSFQLRDSQLLRYEGYKISLVKDRDICIAPVVADGYQNSGVGSEMLRETIAIAKQLRVKQIILWQGTQLTNTRAIHFYEKFGFQKSGEFEKYGNTNVDMTLTL